MRDKLEIGKATQAAGGWSTIEINTEEYQDWINKKRESSITFGLAEQGLAHHFLSKALSQIFLNKRSPNSDFLSYRC